MFMHKIVSCMQMHESCFKVHSNVQMQMSSIAVFGQRFPLLFENATFDYFLEFPPFCWKNFAKMWEKFPQFVLL